MFKEFKAFLLRGNVVDLAVAVVIGAAFTTVVNAVVKNLITPLIAIPGSAADFSKYKFTISGSEFGYGVVINAIISFVIVAAVIFFAVVRPINNLMAKRKTEPDVEDETQECPHCLSNIPRPAAVCAFCTREVTSAAA